MDVPVEHGTAARIRVREPTVHGFSVVGAPRLTGTRKWRLRVVRKCCAGDALGLGKPLIGQAGPFFHKMTGGLLPLRRLSTTPGLLTRRQHTSFHGLVGILRCEAAVIYSVLHISCE
jgi:hypothetical protein